MRCARWIAGVVAVSLAVLPARLPAQTPPPVPATGPTTSGALPHARAGELKKRGDELLDAKHYLEALEAYDASYALEPSAALLYNRGRALQFLARYPEALDAIERFAAEAPPELLARVPALAQLRRDLHARVGQLAVRSKVAGARVLVNERQAGVTPLAAPLEVAAGHVVVEAFAEGYFPVRRELDVAGGTTVDLAFDFVSRDTSGVVVVKSHVDGTSVLLDEKLVGLAPVEAGLLRGQHRVAGRKEGYGDVSTQIVLRAGDKKEVWVDPVAQAPIYARWWFWTAIGVAVAAGVVTAIALTVEKSPGTGDYSPGGVRF